MTTALELVNNVLRELRETEVQVFTGTYTNFVLQQVNKAKAYVEGVRPWPALRTVITFPTVNDTELYSLQSVGTVGDGFYYLVRATNACSSGGFGPGRAMLDPLVCAP